MAKNTRKQKVIIDYDQDSDSLSLTLPGTKSSQSLEIGDIIVDFDHKNKVIGLEILNASALLSILSSKDVSKEMLRDMDAASLEVKSVGNNIFVFYELQFASLTLKESLSLPSMSQRALAA